MNGVAAWLLFGAPFCVVFYGAGRPNCYCEDLLHTFTTKICTHNKTRLEVELDVVVV